MTDLHMLLLAPWVGGVLLAGVWGGWLWRGLKPRAKKSPNDLRTRRNVQYFCASCVVSEGETHLDWCHREGVMAR